MRTETCRVWAAGVAVMVCAGCIDGGTGIDDGLLDCELGQPVTLQVGSVMRDTEGGGTFCVGSPEGGTYALIPFVSGPRDTLARVLVSVRGTGLATVPASLESNAPLSLEARTPDDVRTLLDGHEVWHAAFNARTDRELEALMLESAVGSPRSDPPLPPTRAPARVPAVGETLMLNVAGSCEQSDLRAARVAAVSSRAIVAFDPA